MRRTSLSPSGSPLKWHLPVIAKKKEFARSDRDRRVVDMCCLGFGGPVQETLVPSGITSATNQKRENEIGADIQCWLLPFKKRFPKKCSSQRGTHGLHKELCGPVQRKLASTRRPIRRERMRSDLISNTGYFLKKTISTEISITKRHS